MCVSTLESASSSIRMLGIANQGAGDGGALLLSARKRDAALADHGVVAVGKALDVGGDVGCIGGVVNLLVGGVVNTQGDVLADAFAEQESFLRYEADAPAQGRRAG